MGNLGEHPHEVHHHHIPFARHDNPDAEVAERWTIAAAIIGSSMAFIDGTVANVALPSIQNALDLPPGQKAALRAEQVNLSANEVLKGASSEDRIAIDHAVDQAFISPFRLAMVVSAGMALTSAAAASLLIQGKRDEEPG